MKNIKDKKYRIITIVSEKIDNNTTKEIKRISEDYDYMKEKNNGELIKKIDEIIFDDNVKKISDN